MMSLLRLIFPGLVPAPTVENLGVSMASMAIPGVVDDRDVEARLVDLLDRPESDGD